MPYTKCVYRNCDNTSQSISMFRFPVHDQERFNLWIQNSGNISLDSLTKGELRCRYICAAHFHASQVMKGDKRSRLLGLAVPIPFSHLPEEGTSSQDNGNKSPETDLSSPEVLRVKTPKKFYEKNAMQCKIRTPSSCKSEPPIVEETYLITPTTQSILREGLHEGPNRRLSRKRLFEGNDNDTPQTKRLKSELLSMQKQNRALKAKISRVRAKTETERKSSVGEYPSEASKSLALMQLRSHNSKKPWTKEEKDFCLSLFYKSPATYYFIRRQGIVLAAPTTIKLWLSKSDCSPGLSSNINQIKQRFENSSVKEKACVICFDEMSNMSNLEYTKKYDLIEGFEDLGSGHRSNKIAKYALVFVIRGLYTAWKLPLAYFLSSSNVKGENLCLLLKAAINKLFNINLLPKVVVCDQATTNQKVFKILGVSSESPFFFCNARKIFALYDVPHIIKNIRNNLLKNDFVHDKNKISFKDIVETYELDKKSSKSRSLTKLTDKHMSPNTFQKMTVSLATQVFSNSVAAAIRTATGTGELKSETAMSTANFVEKINNMFDALNSRNKYDKNPYKHALSHEAKYVRDAINEAIDMFKNLKKISYKKQKNGSFKKIHARPPCFDGIIQSCKAILQLFDEESSDPNITFLITRKLNQDVVENLFARYRQKCGANRNPTSRQLRAVFRSNLVNSLIKLPKSTNCEDERDKFVILEATTTQPTSLTQAAPEETYSCKNIQPSTSKFQNQAINASKKKFESCQHAGSNPITLEQCSVAYFAGYLIKACLSKTECESCKLNLLKGIDLDDEAQLLILNKSYRVNQTIKLKMPSNELLRFVDMAIECFNVNFQSIMHVTSIKSRLFKAILDNFKCEAPELLKISCEEHLNNIVERLISVKINFYCKNNKSNTDSVKNPKIRILKNK